MKVALVGTPLCGKSTLFTAVSGVDSDPAKFHGVKPQPAMVQVPDERLDAFSKHYEPKKHTPTSLEFLDFASIDLGVRSDNAKQLMAAIRDADILVTVLGDHASGAADIAKTWDGLQAEFLFSDLEVMERRIEKLTGSVKKPTKTQDADKKELALLTRIKTALEETESWEQVKLDDVETKSLRGFAFLSLKPVIPVINTDKDLNDAAAIAAVRDKLPEAWRARGHVLNADIEREVRSLEAGERDEFLKEYGIAEMAGPRLIRAAFEATGLISFFTVGPDECRAWTVVRGDDVVTAAGRIHSDLARGFIRAEVFNYDEFVSLGDEKAIKAAGKLRSEGKDYIVKDGDVLHILFAV